MSTDMQPTTPSSPLADAAAERSSRARQDLASRLGLSAEDITISAVLGQEFTAEAFYCSSSKDRIARDEPQASISGFIILLKVREYRYEYHASGDEVIFCRPLP